MESSQELVSHLFMDPIDALFYLRHRVKLGIDLFSVGKALHPMSWLGLWRPPSIVRLGQLSQVKLSDPFGVFLQKLSTDARDPTVRTLWAL